MIYSFLFVISFHANIFDISISPWPPLHCITGLLHFDTFLRHELMSADIFQPLYFIFISLRDESSQ